VGKEPNVGIESSVYRHMIGCHVAEMSFPYHVGGVADGLQPSRQQSKLKGQIVRADFRLSSVDVVRKSATEKGPPGRTAVLVGHVVCEPDTVLRDCTKPCLRHERVWVVDRRVIPV